MKVKVRVKVKVKVKVTQEMEGGGRKKKGIERMEPNKKKPGYFNIKPAF